MELLKLTIDTANDSVDALSEYLMELGSNGIQIIDENDFERERVGKNGAFFVKEDIENLPTSTQVIGFFDKNNDASILDTQITEKLAQLKSFGLGVGTGKITHELIKQEDWSTKWQEFYHPIRMTRFITVRPEWEEYTPSFPDEKVIVLNPGESFGTGDHITTRLALTNIETYLTKNNARVLDVGTGSGILSFAAAKLGAKEIVATDIDEASFVAIKENLDLNPDIQNIHFLESDLLKEVEGKFDIIVANILAEILEPLIPQIDEHLSDDGLVILSGIDQKPSEKLKQQITEAGYEILSQTSEKTWNSLVFRRKKD